MDFKIGDVVTLKGGGKRMTVSGIKDDPENSRIMITCIWFEANGSFGWGFGSSEAIRYSEFDSRILQTIIIKED
jgi:uncharacterized protein YodC (DUF2158 family)